MTLTYQQLTRIYKQGSQMGNQPHAYVDHFGECFHCARSERGHDQLQERLRAKLTRPQETKRA